MTNPVIPTPTRVGVAPAAVGMALMLLGMALFSLNDAMGKWLVGTYSVGQVLLIRSAVALLLIAPALWRLGPSRLVAVERPGLQALRVAFSTGEVVCFYAAVSRLPLADVMTFWLAAPLWVAAASPLLLGERVGSWRWGATGAGFAGVLVALEPFGGGLGQPGAVVLALLGTACFAAMMLTGRQLRGTPDMALVFWQTLGALAAGVVLAPGGWIPPPALDLGLLGLLGGVAVLAHLCITRALKLADAALVAPLQYTLLPWAIVLGWLIFDDTPRPMMLIGGGVIIAAGLAVYLSERTPRRLE